MKLLFPILLLFLSPVLRAQYIPVHPGNQVYDFITELSNSGSILQSDFSKPMSRKQIARILQETDVLTLNSRQQKAREFYLKDFGKEVHPGKDFNRRTDLLYHKDSLFSITVNPILGVDYHLGNTGTAYHWWNGAEAWATAGKWGFWGSLRDNHESERLTQPRFLNQNYGGANFKNAGGTRVDYWEFRGGVSYDFGIGHIGLVKDHFSWGTNYNGSNILSGRTQSFTHISFEIRPVSWFEFRYVHGWLVSEVVDSARSFYNVSQTGSGTDYREVFTGKYLAANFFTFRPWKKLDVSFGNSIVYDYDQPHPAYFIPVIFFKAVDHHLSSGQDNMNSHLFFDISSRLIPKTHMYATLFLDEVAVDRIWDPDESNFWSFKGGIRLTNLIPNLYAGYEHTRSNPLVFEHYATTLTFESNRFNLGHYLRDNAIEHFLILGVRPYRNLDLSLSWTHAEKGPDHTTLGTPRLGIDPFVPVEWESDLIRFAARFQILNDVYVRLSYSASAIEGTPDAMQRYTPEFWRGENNVVSFGINVGF